MVENVSPKKVWEALLSDPDAALIDVRTDAEWNFVGLPDLTASKKQTLLISWQIYPAMEVNKNFAEELRKAGLQEKNHLYFICRSGVRSLAAAEAARAAGFPDTYNVADGFEGPADVHGHRGQSAGWKADGLPWRQR